MMIIAIYLLYLLLVALFAVVAFQFTAWYRRNRMRPSRTGPPPGFERTDEINIDPTTGVRQRVWYHPQTGERYYENIDD